MNYLKLVRLLNLLIILAVLCTTRVAMAMVGNLDIILSHLGFLFLVLATILIAAGGYIINDVFDTVTDKVNRPKKRIIGVTIPIKQAKLFYLIVTFTGLGLGFILTNLMAKPAYFIFFVLSAGLLYLYARVLRKYAIIGNLAIAFLVALSTLLPAIFELLPAITPINREDQLGGFSIFLSVAIFAFLITLVRELVKDIEDIQGDHVARYKTLPIILGAQRSARVAVLILLFTISLIAWYTFTFLYNYKFAVAAVFFGVLAPLGYCSTKLWEATKKSDLSRASLLLKIIMILGICTIPLLIYAVYDAS